MLDIKLSDDTAATIIQKEVRRYLANLGFYEARPKSASQTPSRRGGIADREINLFLEPMSAKRSRSASSKRARRPASRSHSG